jgi:type I restriction enzyme M protein
VEKVESEIKSEDATVGFAGKFGAGPLRINGGSFLFLQHMISKMNPVEDAVLASGSLDKNQR